MTEETQVLLKGTPFEQAYFLYLYALENNWKLQAEI